MYVFMVEYGELSQNYPCYCFLPGALVSSHVRSSVHHHVAVTFFVQSATMNKHLVYSFRDILHRNSSAQKLFSLVSHFQCPHGQSSVQSFSYVVIIPYRVLQFKLSYRCISSVQLQTTDLCLLFVSVFLTFLIFSFAYVCFVEKLVLHVHVTVKALLMQT